MKALIVALAVLAGFAGMGGFTAPRATESTKLVCDPGAARQAQRVELLERFKRERILHKVEGGGVYVLPRFYAIPFDSKQAFASLAYAYLHECRPGKVLRIYDTRTNRPVGTLDDLGLHLKT